MQWHDLLLAVALMLVIEGIVPFVNPGALRRALLKIAKLDDQTLRFAGITAIVIGYLLFNLAV